MIYTLNCELFKIQIIPLNEENQEMKEINAMNEIIPEKALPEESVTVE